ncbi:MAG: helix-turn-helix domain-containing protein [Planctomycetota bacterium]
MASGDTAVRSWRASGGNFQVGVCPSQRYDAATAGCRVMSNHHRLGRHLYALHLVRCGRGSYHDPESGRLDLEAGCVVQRLPDRRHEIRLAAEPFEQCFLMLRRPLYDHCLGLGAIDPDTPVLGPVDQQAVHQAMLTLHAALLQVPLPAPSRILAAVHSVLWAGQDQGRAPRDPIDRACRILARDLGATLSPRQVAASLHEDYERFRRRFRQRMGCSPRDYRMRLRMERAQALIGSWPIKRIARELGFTDQSAFGKQFRRHTGMSPAAYRRAL